MALELFDTAAERIEKRTGLVRLEARGTLRLALRSAGLDPESLGLEQLRVVFERILPGELEMRGVENAAGICDALIVEVAASAAAGVEPGTTGVDEIFRRLGGG